MRPEVFPKWRTVHSYWQIWSQPRQGVRLLGQAVQKSGWHGPKETGAQRAQRVKNSDTACQKGDDAAKKVSGIKRHLAVDTQGFAHGVAVTTAEMTDRKDALFAVQQEQTELRQVQCVLCESGYIGTLDLPLFSGEPRCVIFV